MLRRSSLFGLARLYLGLLTCSSIWCWPSLGQSVDFELSAGDSHKAAGPISSPLSVPPAWGDRSLVWLESSDGQRQLGQLTQPGLLASAQSDSSNSADPLRRELHFWAPAMAAGEVAAWRIVEPADASVQQPLFAWQPEPEGDLLRLADQPVLFYVRPQLDESNPQSRELTYKPFHHLFAPDGRQVTKGAGGLYTHHRGIFFGFNRIRYGDGLKADVWHAAGRAFQTHLATELREAGPWLGRHRVRIGWHGQYGEPFATETRELTVYTTPEGHLIDFVSRVDTLAGPIELDGDPQHAGVHFRAANHVAEISKSQTYYLRTDGAGEPGETRNWEPATGKGPVDLPWNVMSFVIDQDRYSVAYLDHPANPKQARYSERDYGRFGSYFEYTIEPDRPLLIRYRFSIQPGEMSHEQAQSLSEAFVAPVRIAPAG
jgi:hypothetical protein